MTVIPIGPPELAVAAALILMSAGLSLALAMGLQRRLLWSALRMAVQLMAVGYLLRLVFLADGPGLTVTVLAAMVLAAAAELTMRGGGRIVGFGAGVATLGFATTAVTLVAILALAGRGRALDAQYLVPVFGIVLGSALNAASLTLHGLAGQLRQVRGEIETRLALGQDFATALREPVRAAATAGMIPVMNQMAGAGIITLPGIMSGQILAGQEPLQAALYQVFLMALLLSASLGAVALTAWLVRRRIGDDRDRLRLDRVGL